MKLKVITGLIRTTNFIVFVSFLFAATMLYLIGEKVLAGVIVIVMSAYMLYNKTENLEKRVTKLELRDSN